MIKVKGDIVGKPEDKQLTPLQMNSFTDRIFSKIRDKKMDDIGQFLNKKAVSMRKIRDEGNKYIEDPKLLKEFIKRRKLMQDEYKHVQIRTLRTLTARH